MASTVPHTISRIGLRVTWHNGWSNDPRRCTCSNFARSVWYHGRTTVEKHRNWMWVSFGQFLDPLGEWLYHYNPGCRTWQGQLLLGTKPNLCASNNYLKSCPPLSAIFITFPLTASTWELLLGWLIMSIFLAFLSLSFGHLPQSSLLFPLDHLHRLSYRMSEEYLKPVQVQLLFIFWTGELSLVGFH